MDTTTLFAKIDPFFAAAQLQTPMIDRLYASRARAPNRTSGHDRSSTAVTYAGSMARWCALALSGPRYARSGGAARLGSRWQAR